MTEDEIRAVWEAHKTIACIDSELADYKTHCEIECGKFSFWCSQRCEIPQVVAVLKIKRRELLK